MHKYPKLTLITDVDDTCLSLMPTWLSLYESESGHHLEESDILDWNIKQYVLPEFQERFMEYVEFPEVFYGSKPVEGALDGVQFLKSLNWRIVYCSANNPENVKWYWLKEHGFIEKKEDFIQALDKSLIRGDLMLDDKFAYTKSFVGTSFLLKRPWNIQYTGDSQIYRVDNWKHFIETLDGCNLI